MSVTRVTAFGERAIELALDGDDDPRRARRMAAALDRARLPGVVECVPGYGVVLVHVEGLAAMRAVAHAVAALDDQRGEDEDEEDDDRAARVHVVPAIYDGVDLADVATRCRLDVAEVIRRHAAATYAVEVIGFLPGFAYLGGLDPALAVPRHATPRPRVAAGSVAIAGAHTAIYPLDSPGGWRIVARAVGFRPFDPHRAPPNALRPGDRVRFEPVDEVER